MRIKLYLDEDVDISLAHALRQQGIVFLDFLLLHKSCFIDGKNHYGIILSDQKSIGEMLRCLSKLIFSLTAEQMKNRREFLSNWL